MLPQYIETRLDPAATADIFNLYATLSACRVARDVFVSTILMCPPQVTLKSLPGKLSDELNMLLETKWRTWAEALYDGAKQFGIVPYYYEGIAGTIHKYPVVPPFGTYHIVTYVDDKGHQLFKYYNANRGLLPITSTDMERKDIKWWYRRYESESCLPNIFGQYRSPMVTLIRDVRTARILREALEIGAFQAVRPMHVVEHHPPKSGSGDDELTSLEFGEKIAGMVSQQTEQMHSQKMRVKTAELVSAIQRTHELNTAPGTRYSNTETNREVFERENSGFLTRLIPLPSDRSYKSASAPALLGDLDEVEKRIDTAISGIMDFPRELLQPQSSVRGTNVQGNLRFWNERQKYWMSVFARAYKHVLLDVYGSTMQSGLDLISKRRKTYNFERQMALYVATDLEVEFSCSPIATFEDFAALHAFGIIKKETVGAYMLHQFGIPASDLHVTKEPDMMPSLADQEKAKGDAKMDLEKFKVKEKAKIKPATK